MARDTCQVLYCKHRRLQGCSFFRFPRDLKRCKEWVRRLGIEDFVGLTPDILHNKRLVCSCHFQEKDFRSGTKKRLNNQAVPSILDERIVPLSDTVLSNFMSSEPLIVPGFDPKALYRKCTSKKMTAKSLDTTPVKVSLLTSKESLAGELITMLVVKEDGEMKRLVSETDKALLSNCASKQIIAKSLGAPPLKPYLSTSKESLAGELKTMSVVKEDEKGMKRLVFQTGNVNDSGLSTFIKRKRNRPSVATKKITVKRLKQEAGILDAENTPELLAVLNLLHQEKLTTKSLEEDLLKKTRECETLQTKLKSAVSENSNKATSHGLKLLNELSARNMNKKAGGERYTNEEMLFAIGIYKRSAKCYKYLQNFIKLPCERTLLRSFSKLNLQLGANENVFDALKKAVASLSDPD